MAVVILVLLILMVYCSVHVLSENMKGRMLQFIDFELFLVYLNGKINTGILILLITLSILSDFPTFHAQTQQSFRIFHNFY